jgi:GNAT superfamily N-acetyltransferase
METTSARPVQIRDAEAGDADALARLCTQLGYPANAAAVRARLSRLSAGAGTRVLVASRNAEVSGLATVHIRHTLNHAAPLAQLTLLVVDERVRGMGIGRTLVESAEAWARDQGCHRMIVTTALHRSEAHAFYDRIGYAHTGRRYGKDFS